MQYILLIYGDEREWESMSKDEMERVYAAHGAYSEAMTKAKRGRFNNSRPKTLDGPFAETKEQLGGYYVIEVDNLEQALEWASKMPGMTSGAVEVRPLGAH